MRSLLVVPGDDARRVQDALPAGADAIVLDLAGSVGPARKDQARHAVRAWLAAARSTICLVRVNRLRSAWIDEDLAAVLPSAPDGIVLDEARGASDVQDLAARLAVCEARHGMADGRTGILAVAGGTASSIFAMGSFSGCSRRLIGIAWDAESLRADLGAGTIRTTADVLTGPYALARALALVAARAAGVPAFDTADPDTADPDTADPDTAGSDKLHRQFAHACAAAHRDGFAGKLALHAGQVRTINAAFSPPGHRGPGLDQ